MTGKNQLFLLCLGSSLKMGARTERNEFGSGYGDKILMEVGPYFKHKIQSNILSWPNTSFAIDPCKY